MAAPAMDFMMPTEGADWAPLAALTVYAHANLVITRFVRRDRFAQLSAHFGVSISAARCYIDIAAGLRSNASNLHQAPALLWDIR